MVMSLIIMAIGIDFTCTMVAAYSELAIFCGAAIFR
jgi:hypothetical protein